MTFCRSARPRTVGCSSSSPRTTACKSWSDWSPQSRPPTWRREAALSEFSVSRTQSMLTVTSLMIVHSPECQYNPDKPTVCYLNITNCIRTPHNYIVCLLFKRFPNIACELLTSDVSIINDKLGSDESLLEMLYHFLEQDPPLNPLLASFFSKTIGNLIARKTEQVLRKNVWPTLTITSRLKHVTDQ